MASSLLPALSSISSSKRVDFIFDDIAHFEDECSICLDPFSSIDPPAVTKCKHDYHLHCILEWSQRSNECPMCSEHLVLNDPASQELLAGIERDKILRLRRNSHPNNEVINRIVRQFSAVASRARNISRRRRRQRTVEIEPSQIQPVQITNTTSDETQINTSNFSHIDSATFVKTPIVSQPASFTTSPSPALASPPMAENLQFPAECRHSKPDKSGKSSSESLKSKLSSASAKLSKRTRGLKEKLVARNDSVKEPCRGVQCKMSAGIAKMIERLHITQIRAFTGIRGTSNSPRAARGMEEGKIVN
ncbi:hypothetical protein ACJIZ3_017622 [Penstemon smallii]|uniref:RING-type E3 ubiquitin transferase n=1 Tax=Penstemon smallii TaxID=265156 RepID=A0ABD3SWV0_9LAMI